MNNDNKSTDDTINDENNELDEVGDSNAPYQDDLTTDESTVDPIIDEETDDPTEELGIPPEEFKRELDKYDVDNTNDDRRESIEDLDEADDNAASGTQ